MNDLHNRFPRIHPSERNVFTDDAANIAIGKGENTVINRVPQDLKIFEEWAKDHNLNFSAGKTKVMMFSKRKIVKLKPLYLKAIEIEWVYNLKYLKVI